jgi:REP element-mobilizing transposase RayT
MFDAEDELEPVGYHVYFHCVFSTKGQEALIAPELERDLWVCIDGLARLHSMRTLAVGGTDDHCHILLFLPEDVSLDQAVRLIKSGSQDWMREFHGKHDFAWQEGYGAFSVSRSDIPALTEAILNQAELHRTVNYQTEFLALLKANNIEFDPTDGWE